MHKQAIQHSEPHGHKQSLGKTAIQ